MFERYTEKARRVIFFARYEASEYGSPSIETEHLLLGVMREDHALTNRFIGDSNATEAIRRQIDACLPLRQKTSTSVDLPLADPCKRSLTYAAEEADRLAHRHIGTEHLLLGMLREKDCLAALTLTEHGLKAEDIRASLSKEPNETSADIPNYTPQMTHGLRATPSTPSPARERRRSSLLRSIRIWLGIVILGLFLSGVTAFPLQHELVLTLRIAARIHLAQHAPSLNAWFFRVYTALADTNARYPFLAYGTDWLAFAHLVIAVAFIGPYLDPVRNKWFITWGFISCAGVIPLALIAGPVRGIPFYWRCIDCSFGVFCCLCLLVIRRSIQQLERLTANP